MIHPSPHGGQLRRIAAQFHVDPARILDFSANINPDGTPPSVLTALRTALEQPENLSVYPDLDLHHLRLALSTHHTLPPQSFSIANGFIPLLEAVLRLRTPQRCLLPVPAFNEYRRTLTLNHVEPVPYPLQPQAFQYNPPRLSAALFSSQAEAILLANPQNPSGHLTPAATLRSLVEQCPNTLILLDEAFLDYTPAETLAPLTQIHPNLIVFRSLTKFFAIPGLRVAYCIARPDVAASLNRTLAPWPISTLASVAAIAALNDTPFHQQARTVNAQRRITLAQSLHALAIHPYPASANFLLLPLSQPAEPLWRELLLTHHTLLRPCTDFEHLEGPHLRTAIRTEQENQQLVHALAQAL